MSRLLMLLGGWKGYAVASLLSALLAAGGASYVTALGYRLTISQIRRDHAASDARATKAMLADFVTDAARIHAAAQAMASLENGLGRRFDYLSKDFHDAIQSHPLPSDCVPDAGRLRTLRQAVAAANAATGAKSGSAVPGAD